MHTLPGRTGVLRHTLPPPVRSSDDSSNDRDVPAPKAKTKGKGRGKKSKKAEEQDADHEPIDDPPTDEDGEDGLGAGLDDGIPDNLRPTNKTTGIKRPAAAKGGAKKRPASGRKHDEDDQVSHLNWDSLACHPTNFQWPLVNLNVSVSC